MPNIFETTDWSGQVVVLRPQDWKHALAGHPEIASRLGVVQLAVEDPDMVIESHRGSPSTGSTRLVMCRLLDALRPSSSLRMVVPIVYTGRGNFVMTAYVTPKVPKGNLIHVAKR